VIASTAEWASGRVDPLTFAWVATIALIVAWVAITLGWQAVSRRRARRQRERFQRGVMRSAMRAWFVRDLLRRHAEQFWERHR
jgi:hypothetical protein